MKHFNLICAFILLSFAGIAQTNPCPIVESNTLVRFATAPNCTGQVIVFASASIPADKSLRIVVYLGSDNTGTILTDTCLSVEGRSPSTEYRSPVFAFPCGAALTYEVIPYTSSNTECTGTECGPRTTATDPGTVLPINLKSFTGNRKANSIVLNWSTAQEINGSYFEVQRNTGSGFQKINTTNARNSALGALYQFEDVNITKSAVQYRLKIVDIDGSFKYSEVVSIKPFSSVSDVSIYPNPAVQGSARISISDVADITTIQVYDLRGTVLKSIPVTGNMVNLSDLQAGTYLLKMVNANTGGSATKRLIILN